eukprot:TRINITY_DN6934_c0_g1_i3.p2 TRINITY_DN6934_c0_g1~~TRINITY_DN6934_c0_g1_i3.p2  ORF type:complete len:121 (+),score=39.59 TRINITY_DN6934_c0_g1_i3:51-365(+)
MENIKPVSEAAQTRTGKMNFGDLANLLDNDGNMQNEMMVASFAATMLATIPVLLGNEFDVNVGLRKKRSLMDFLRPVKESQKIEPEVRKTSTKFFLAEKGSANE